MLKPHNPSIPPTVCKLIEKMMAKHPDDRHPNTAVLIKEINQIQNNLTSSKRTPKSKSQPIRIKAGGKTTSPRGARTGSFKKDAGSSGRNKAAGSTNRNKPGRTDRNKPGRTDRNRVAGSTGRNKSTVTGRSSRRSGRNVEEVC